MLRSLGRYCEDESCDSFFCRHRHYRSSSSEQFCERDFEQFFESKFRFHCETYFRFMIKLENITRPHLFISSLELYSIINKEIVNLLSETVSESCWLFLAEFNKRLRLMINSQDESNLKAREWENLCARSNRSLNLKNWIWKTLAILVVFFFHTVGFSKFLFLPFWIDYLLQIGILNLQRLWLICVSVCLHLTKVHRHESFVFCEM